MMQRAVHLAHGPPLFCFERYAMPAGMQQPSAKRSAVIPIAAQSYQLLRMRSIACVVYRSLTVGRSRPLTACRLVALGGWCTVQPMQPAALMAQGRHGVMGYSPMLATLSAPPSAVIVRCGCAEQQHTAAPTHSRICSGNPT